MANKVRDINGWFEVKDNPISKVGVFEYSGRQIDGDGKLGLDPDARFNVFRPPEELSNKECIDSFKLLPWIDNHEMLGRNFTPAEQKGISGVIGEDIYYDEADQELKANIKVFSNDLDAEIEKGKRELSSGYRCGYTKKSGIFAGQSYDFVQHTIRGNHLASVDDGRMGPEVAVKDSKLTFTIDSKELIMNIDELAELIAKIDERLKAIETSKAADEEEKKKAADEDPDKDKDKPAGDADPDEDKDKDKPAGDADPDEDKDKPAGDEDPDKKEAEGMDSLLKENKSMKKQIAVLGSSVAELTKNGTKILLGEIGKRDALAKNLAEHIGTFDHSEKTLQEVAVYGVEKLKLECSKGQELPILNGFFHGRQAGTTHALDAKSGDKMEGMDEYLNDEGGKK